jgi:hypothetical protein
MGGELRGLPVAAEPPGPGRDESAAMNTISAPRPARAYQRQTPSVWQALGRAVWESLEASGRRRAARELRELAQRWEPIDPSLAAQMRAAARFSDDASKDTP